MGKQYLFIILVLLMLPVEEGLQAQENVGVGTTSPSYRLDIQGNPASMGLINVNSKVNYSGMLDIRAFEGYSLTADGYGIGGKFTGGYRGVESLAQGGTYAGTTYGVFSNSIGTAGTRVGVYGTASGGTTANYGVWGTVNGGANFYGVYGQNTNLAGYAGYFNGRVFFTQELRADKNLVVDDTTWTSRIWSQSGAILIKSLSDLELTIDRNNSGGIIGFFELFNGAGEQLFWVSEGGHGRIFGNYFVGGNLGVGTTTPTTKFQIHGGSDVSLTTNGIEFSVRHAGKIEIVAARQIQEKLVTLHSGELPSGKHNIEVDISGLPSEFHYLLFFFEGKLAHFQEMHLSDP